MNSVKGSFIQTSDDRIGIIFSDEEIAGDGFYEIWYGKFDTNNKPIIELSRISRDWIFLKDLVYLP